MKQEKILFNGIEIKQPDSGSLGVSFDTTYTDDSGRIMSGVALATPLFTVEAYSYKATDLTLQETNSSDYRQRETVHCQISFCTLR